MANHLEVADLMAENGRLRDTIEAMRNALEQARPYVAECADFQHSSTFHQKVLVAVDRAMGIHRSYSFTVLD